jgi:hypothetical protein
MDPTKQTAFDSERFVFVGSIPAPTAEGGQPASQAGQSNAPS